MESLFEESVGVSGGITSQEGAIALKSRLVGQSPMFSGVLESISTVAPRRSPVVILGETGAGKEMVAREIHARSQRASKVFIPVDCTSLSGQIFESQLFGHIKGAFTGAIRDSLGFFRAANGGTIFLDEIGELDPELQAKLLRVLQESCVIPVGATESCPIDIRLLCATNCDLKQMVREGKFRSDLYFRINVFKIEVPPLRERKDDILVLASHFLQKQAALYGEPVKKLLPDAAKLLCAYDWPGNVRELANVIEYAHISSGDLVIDVKSLPEDIVNRDIVLAMEDEEFMSYEQLQKKLVIRALKKTRGRKMAAARLLKIDHRKLDRLVQQFNLDPTWK
jgi:two-component system, NtrC family, response regulator AtoC